MNFHYYFEIRELEGDLLVKEVGPYMSAKMRDRAMDGAETNMNHEDYYAVPTQRLGA